MKRRWSREARIALEIAAVILLGLALYVLAVCAVAFNGGQAP